MNITIVGSGNMASAFVRQLSAASHKVSVTGRNHDKAAELARQHPGVEALTPQDAGHDADVIIVATPYPAAVEALRSLGNLQGKVVLDITNPLTADYMGLTVGHETSAAEQIARSLPDAIVVKGFNTLFAQVLAAGAEWQNKQKVTVFLASDDESAKKKVRSMSESMGFQVMDAGGLKNARYLEPLAGLNIYFGYGAGHGTGIAPAWIRSE